MTADEVLRIVFFFITLLLCLYCWWKTHEICDEERTYDWYTELKEYQKEQHKKDLEEYRRLGLVDIEQSEYCNENNNDDEIKESSYEQSSDKEENNEQPLKICIDTFSDVYKEFLEHNKSDDCILENEKIKKDDSIADYPLFKTLKKSLIDETKKYDRTYSKYNKFNTVYNNNVILKGKQQSKIRNIQNCCIAIDVSPSVSNDTKNRIIDCLYGIVRKLDSNAQIVLIYWDTKIISSQIINSRTDKKDIIIPCGSGTDIQCLFNANLNNVDKKALQILSQNTQTFILTDGKFNMFNVKNNYFKKVKWLIHTSEIFDSSLANQIKNSEVEYLDYL